MLNARPAMIGVFGHYGNQNLGDEAIVTAVIENLRRRAPNVRLTGFSINPADTAQQHGIPAFPIRKEGAKRKPAQHTAGDSPSCPPVDAAGLVEWLKRSLKKTPVLREAIRILIGVPRALNELLKELRFCGQAYRNLKDVDLLLFAGSNQFEDSFGGPFAFPYTLLKWSVIAKFTGARTAFVSVGAGPLNVGLSRFQVRLALTLADYVSLRDAGSQAVLRAIGYRGACPVYPDLAHSLTIPPSAIDHSGEARPLICINAMPVYDARYWHRTDDGKYKAYVTHLADFAVMLLREGYPLMFFTTQPKDLGVINDVTDLIEARGVENLAERCCVKASRSVAELMHNLASGSMMVATRYHGVLLSLLAGKPVLAICYHRKTRELMTDMGQAEYALDFETFDSATAMARFKALEASVSRQATIIRVKEREYREALEHQYADLVSLLQKDVLAPAASL